MEAAQEAIEDGKAMFQVTAINSYQTLLNGLMRYSVPILTILGVRLRSLMAEVDETKFRVGLWLVLAVDGSRVSTCRTLANEKRFCKPRNSDSKTGRKKKKKKRGRHAIARKPVNKKKHYDPQPVGPQVWLTLLWHVGMQMPWAWKTGPSYSSERDHLLNLLKTEELPEHTLICGDAGFVGYDFWKAIEDRGHHFLIRVGSNCTFLKKLGRVRERDGIVYCWPQEKQKRKQPPLVLRLMRFHDGRGELYLVTNVLNERNLSNRQCQQIYRQRWGIELQFRALKQTYDRSKLLGRTPEVVEQELNWSIVSLWMVQLLAHREQVEMINPDQKTSIALVLRIIQNILRRPERIARGRNSLKSQLSRATTDTYQRQESKKSRNFPRRKEEPSAGPPKIRVAQKWQIRLAKEIGAIKHAA